MKRLIILTALCLPLVMWGAVKESPDTLTARKAFVELPSQVIDLLQKEKRLDMLDYFDNDSIVKMSNEMDGVSYLTEVAPDYLKVQITPVSSLQLKVLPAKKGNILMTIYTTGEEGDAKDSEVVFYDSGLNELDDSRYFKFPELKEFFNIPKGSATTMAEIQEMMPFYTVDIEAKSGSDTVTATLTPGDFVSVEDMNIVKLYMQPVVKYQWDGKSLKIIK